MFIFLVAYFFALRESGKNRFWFLVYFPVSMRASAKRIFTKSGELFGTFAFVEARLFLLTFIILSIGFSVLGFESPIGSAFLVSLADSLPLLGIGLFLIPMSAFFLYSNQLFIGVSLALLYIFRRYDKAIGRIIYVGFRISSKADPCLFHYRLFTLSIWAARHSIDTIPIICCPEIEKTSIRLPNDNSDLVSFFYKSI